MKAYTTKVFATVMALVMSVFFICPMNVCADDTYNTTNVLDVPNLSEYAEMNKMNIVVQDEDGIICEEYHSDGLCVNYVVDPVTKKIQTISNNEGIRVTVNRTVEDTIYTTYNSKDEVVKSYSIPNEELSRTNYNLSTENILKCAQSEEFVDDYSSDSIATVSSDYIENGYNLSNMMPSVWTVAMGSDRFGRPKNAMTQAQIQAFFESKDSVLQKPIVVWAYDANHNLYNTGRKVTPSKVINDASVSYGINPKILLGKLQGESSLVYKKNADVNSRSFAYCMGYNATDAGDILSGTGFDNQILNAARVLLHHWNTAYEAGKSDMPYYFETYDGELYVDNCGTYALFTYTPWINSNLVLANVFEMMFPGSGQNGVNWN